MEWLKGYGWLEYNPTRREIKKIRAADDWWLTLTIPGDVCKYYVWWMQKEKGISLQLPVWRPHITILNGRKPVSVDKQHLWKKYQGEKINFEYQPNIEQNWKFWSLPVRSNRIHEIRKELGVDDDFPFHITVGREFEVEPNLEIVKYGL